MVLKRSLFIFLISLSACERIPESERRSVLIDQEETTKRLQEFRSWLWTCRSADSQSEETDQEVLGQSIEKFVDIFRSRGLSSLENFDVSQIRSTAFLWRDTGVLVSNLSSFVGVKSVQCTDGVVPWTRVQIRGVDRALDLIVLELDRAELKKKIRWASRADRPRIHEDLLLLSMSYPGQIDAMPVRVQPQLSQMRTGIDSDLLLFSPAPNVLFKGGVLVDQNFKVLGLTSFQTSRLWGTALSASRIEETVDLLSKKGAVNHPYLGFKLSPREEGGLVIQQVEVGSPAYRAGLRVDDIMLSWNGIQLKSAADWLEPTTADIAKNISLAYERNKKIIETKLTVGVLN